MDKREAILKSVLKLVNRSGFYHLNMKDIAQEAGVAAGTIYLYFKGKEDLINALYAMVLADFNKSVIKEYNEENPVKDNFFLMLHKALKFYVLQPDCFSFIEQYTYAPFLFKEIRDENFMLLMPIYKMLRQGKKEGILKNMPDAIMLALIHGSLNTIVKLHLAGKTDLTRKSARHKFCEACWSAVSKDGEFE